MRQTVGTALTISAASGEGGGVDVNGLAYLLAPALAWLGLPAADRPDGVGQGARSESRSAAAQIGLDAGVVHQVRIEQRVIIRIAPAARVVPHSLVRNGQQPAPLPVFEERDIGRCIPVRTIAAARVQPDNRVLLYLRNRRLIAMQFNGRCPAEAFYSGFYVEPAQDGLLCARRDLVQSRAGAKCQVAQMRELVPRY